MYLQEFKKVVRLGAPMVVTQLLWMSMPVVDNIMVGSLGGDALAALAIAGAYFTFFLVGMIGVISAINPMVSQAHGAKDYALIPKIVHQGLISAFILSTAMVVGLSFSNRILLLLGQPEHLVRLGSEYLHAMAFGVPFQALFICLRQFCDGVEDPKPTIVMVFLASILNIPFDYVLIHGAYGFPKLGVAGAGVATSTLNAFLALGLLAYTFKSKKYKAYFVWKNFHFSKSLFHEIWRVGGPSAGTFLAEVGYFASSTLLVGLLGASEVASHQIALNIASVSFMIPMGLGFAVSVRVGHYVGMKKQNEVQVPWSIGMVMALIISIGAALLFYFGGEYLVRIYTSDPAIVILGTKLLKIAGIFQVFDALQAMGVQSLKGLKDTKLPFLYTMISYWIVGMGVSVYCGFHLLWGPEGVWFGMVVSLLLVAVLLWRRFIILTRPKLTSS